MRRADVATGAEATQQAPYDPEAYWSERLAGDAGLEDAGWRGLGAAYNAWLYRRRAAVFRQVVRHYGWGRRPPSVLELGPGTGFYVDLWRRIGVRDLTGIEIAAPAVTRLRERFPGYHFLSGDIGRPISLPPHSFDVVTAFDVLFHITDDAAFRQAIATIARALRPGGVALITDLFPATTPVRLAHHASRTAWQYREALTAQGLTVDHEWPVFVLMHPWAEPRPGVARMAARLWWGIVQRAAGHLPGAGGPLGAGLFALDSLLARVVRTGPSTRLWAIRGVGR